MKDARLPTKGLNAFQLKIIAIVAMACNHTAHVFGAQFPLYLAILLEAVGGLTFPIMAFLLVEGYRKTTNLKRYFLRLFVFAMLSVVPFFFAFNAIILNVLFTLLLGLFTLYLYDHLKNKMVFWLCFAGIVCLTKFCDWSFIGVALLFAFGQIKDNKRRIILPLVSLFMLVALLSVIFQLRQDHMLELSFWENTFFVFFSMLTIPLLLLYNGQRGRSSKASKYLFYGFYPGHLLILYLLKIGIATFSS